MKKLMLALLVFSFSLSSCDILSQLEIPTGTVPLSEMEIATGLKEALKVGTTNAINRLGEKNGFLNSPYKVLFPPEVQVVEQKLRQFGFGSLADQLIAKLNEGAEAAVKEAGPIFGDAIMAMTINDARNILKGPDNAATEYFRQKTSTALFNAFKPKVKPVLDQVGLTNIWSQVMTTYNSIPLVKKVEADLPKYVTEKTMEALFTNIAIEEKNIRENPAARVSAILQRVFGATNI